MPHSWTINGRYFPSTASAGAFIRQILARYADGEQVNAEDEAFLQALFKNHRHYQDGILAGSTIAYTYVHYLPDGTRRFDVMRANGDKRDVAWRHCLEVNPDPMRQITSIVRHLAQPQIEAFRERENTGQGWTCAICNELLLFSRDMAVDHLPPWTFERLLADWIDMYSIDPAAVRIRPHHDYQGHSSFADRRLADTWIDYHQLNAQLRILCLKCHAEVTRQAARGRARERRQAKAKSPRKEGQQP